jgi:hypothetical protein
MGTSGNAIAHRYNMASAQAGGREEKGDGRNSAIIID